MEVKEYFTLRMTSHINYSPGVTLNLWKENFVFFTYLKVNRESKTENILDEFAVNGGHI